MLKKKNLGQFSKNYRTFYPKNCTKLSKMWVWDPGSGISLLRITDPDTQHLRVGYCTSTGSEDVVSCQKQWQDSGSVTHHLARIPPAESGSLHYNWLRIWAGSNPHFFFYCGTSPLLAQGVFVYKHSLLCILMVVCVVLGGGGTSCPHAGHGSPAQPTDIWEPLALHQSKIRLFRP